MAAKADIDATIRLAALAGRARCNPADIPAGLVAAAVDLIRAVGQNPAPTEHWASPPKPKKQPAPAADVPPFITAAFEQIEHSNTAFAPTTGLLRELHRALGDRITDRALLVSEQLRSPDAGTRLDGIRMAGDVMKGFRGDHSALIHQIADQLSGPVEVAAEATAVWAPATGSPSRPAKRWPNASPTTTATSTTARDSGQQTSPDCDAPTRRRYWPWPASATPARCRAS